MSLWIIRAEDGHEVGHSQAGQAKTAFWSWRMLQPTVYHDIEVSDGPDGTSRVTYQGKTFFLKKTAEVEGQTLDQ